MLRSFWMRVVAVVVTVALAAAGAVAIATAASARAAGAASFAAPVCDDATAIDVNDASRLRYLLAPLVDSNFFGIFHVSLDTPCPFWKDDDGQCAVRECSVCNCPENEVPVAWRAADSLERSKREEDQLSADNATPTSQGDMLTRFSSFSARDAVGKIIAAEMPSLSSLGQGACEKSKLDDSLNDVDRSHPDNLNPSLANWAPPSDPDDWTVQDAPNSEMIYVDLRKNPERYTGYDGPQTLRVWSAIYDENCFAFSSSCKSGICAPGTCKEERILYRLISGVHTSISMHIAHDFLHGMRWGTNLQVFASRIRAFPERVTNLYVALALVLRAVAKISPSLDPVVYDFSTGNTTADSLTVKNVRALLAHPLLKHGCKERIFDESDMFVENAEARLPEFRTAFRNISMIMDCVGCEKCRLWGKLQFLGLGTALRLLFSKDSQPELKRNEAIALFNLMNKLLSSVVWIDELNRAVEQRAVLTSYIGKVCAFFVFVSIALWLNHTQQQRRRSVHGRKGSAHEQSSKVRAPEENGTVGKTKTAGKEIEADTCHSSIRRRRKAVVD